MTRSRIPILLKADRERLQLAARLLQQKPVLCSPTDSTLSGDYRTRIIGRGLLPADLCEYQPGMDVRRIAWKASARSGRTMVKTFEEERCSEILIVIDCAAEMAADGGYDFACEMAVAIAALALRNGDAPGILINSGDTANESGIDLLAPRTGRRRLAEIVALLGSARGVSRITLAELITRGLNQIRNLSLRRPKTVVVLSTFLEGDYAELPAALGLARAANLNLVSVLPEIVARLSAQPGMLQLYDPRNAAAAVVDAGSTAFRNRTERRLGEHRRALQNLAVRCGGRAAGCSGELSMAVRSALRGQSIENLARSDVA